MKTKCTPWKRLSKALYDRSCGRRSAQVKQVGRRWLAIVEDNRGRVLERAYANTLYGAKTIATVALLTAVKRQSRAVYAWRRT